jgi:hypothetical protein
MFGLTHSRLLNIASTVPPYRGTLDRFPIADRKQNHKNFIVREVNGAKVFDIVYGCRYDTTQITKEQYDAAIAAGSDRVHANPSDGGKTEWLAVRYYTEYTRVHNVLGTVHADNTFNFTKGSYNQGEQMFLSSYSNGYFSNDSRRGGMVFKYSRSMFPVWKGMSINCETGYPTVPYQVTTRVVDRKKSRLLVANEERFYKVSEAMLKAMDAKTLVETAVDVVNGIFGEGAHKEYRRSGLYLPHAQRLMDSAPLDAFILYVLTYDIGRLESVMRSQGSPYPHTNLLNTLMDGLFANTKRRLNNELYKANPDVFKSVEHPMGAVYPASDWGTLVTANGVYVEQY